MNTKATETIYKPYGMRHAKPQLVCLDGMTKQNHQDECDVNLIVKTFRKSGVIEHRNEHEAMYQELTSQTLHEALNITTSAQSMFEELPSKLRNKFKNDPGLFLDYVQDDKNYDEACELGLVEQRPGEPAPIKVEVTNTEKEPETVEK